jgi:SAM-dependent methyltransferase
MNSSRVWLERELRDFAAKLKPGARVLDAGAGDQIYRKIFGQFDYEAADFEKVDKPYAKSTYVCDLAALPVENERFDAVVFSQVMEHLPEPLATLKELNRVLKPGGMMFCSAPLYYEEHELPYDYFRYTQFGARHLFSLAGFEVTSLRWLEGYMGTVAHQLRSISRNSSVNPKCYGGNALAYLLVASLLLSRPMFWLVSTIAKRTDVNRRFTEAGHPINYFAILRKPG